MRVRVRRRLTIWVCAFLTRSVCTFDVDACIRAWRYRCFGGLRHMMRRFRSGNTCCEYRDTRLPVVIIITITLFHSRSHLFLESRSSLLCGEANACNSCP